MFPPKDLNYLVFQFFIMSVRVLCTKLGIHVFIMSVRVMCTNLDIYVFIKYVLIIIITVQQ